MASWWWSCFGGDDKSEEAAVPNMPKFDGKGEMVRWAEERRAEEWADVPAPDGAWRSAGDGIYERTIATGTVVGTMTVSMPGQQDDMIRAMREREISYRGPGPIDVPGVTCEYAPYDDTWVLNLREAGQSLSCKVTVAMARNDPGALRRAAQSLRNAMDTYGPRETATQVRLQQTVADIYSRRMKEEMERSMLSSLYQQAAAITPDPSALTYAAVLKQMQDLGLTNPERFIRATAQQVAVRNMSTPWGNEITQEELRESRRQAIEEMQRSRGQRPTGYQPFSLSAYIPKPEPEPEPEPVRRAFPELELGDADVAAPVAAGRKLDID